jgi:hypothetical protein
LPISAIVNDCDLNAKGQTGWVGWGNHTIVFGKKPEMMQTLVLSDKSIGTASAVASKDKLAITWGSIKN